VSFDPEVTSYQKVLDFFFTIHDPTTKDRQGNDRGDSYRSAIFYQNSDEKLQAEAMIEIVNQSGRWMSPVVTNLEEFK
jgi:peptide-methionine (S)-S-oxide reductase